MPAIVRPASFEEADAIRGLMRRVIEVTVAAPFRPETIENVEGNVAVWLDRPTRCVHLVAALNDVIVGVILVKDFWNLCSLFVEPSRQGGGIGRLLVEAAVLACKPLSPKKAIWLNSSPNAVGFYEHLGFRPAESALQLPPVVRPMQLSLSSLPP